MGTVFRFAIEEGRIIENEILLEDGEFVVRSNVFVTKVVPTKRQSVAAREPMSSWRFRVIDLARLTEIFQRVAPYGTVSERAFVYILQDLVGHGREEGESMLLPCSWYQLRGSQVSELVHCLFGDVDHIDWRQLIVYAMELPWPSQQDLLIARDRFRAQDPESRETVTRAQYHRTALWFLDRALTDTEHHHDLLQDDFQWTVDRPDEEEPYRSCRDDGDSMISKLGKGSGYDARLPSIFEDEMFRRTFAKELLCRMYAVDRRTINYTALLLVFCKDDDPREGFGKAVTLALGNRVCTDEEEGERYVQEIYERKRLGLSWQTVSRSEALEVARRILDRLVDRATTSLSENESEDESAKVSRASLASSYFSNIEFEGEAISFVESSTSAERDKEAIVYWLSLDLCLTVLAATLPWHALRPEIFGNHSNLRDRLSAVYEELRDEHLNERKNVALAHRLLNHEFMKRLLNSVSNFTVKNIGDTVKKILRAGERT
nr:PREDICTED: uncharacterized protein LOC105664050 [Megachile rotundata]